MAGGAVVVVGGAAYYLSQTSSPATTPTSSATSTLTSSLTPTNIIVWSNHEEDSLRQAYVTTAQAFMSSTDSTVTALAVPTVDFPTKFAAALAANSIPDIITPSADLVKAYMAKGLFEPLDDVISQYGASNLYENPTNDFSYQGVHYGIDFFNDVCGLTYRKDLLQAASVNVPTTWDQLLDAAKALTNTSGQYGFGFASGNFPVANWGLYTFMRTNNADIFDESGNQIFDSSETTETFEFMRQLAPYWPAESKGWSWTDCKRASYSGLLALDWYEPIAVLKDSITYSTPAISATIGAGLTPIHTTNFTYMEETGLCVPKGGQSGNLALTKQLILNYMKPENAVQFSSGNAPIDYNPALIPVQNLTQYWSDPKISAYAGLFKQVIPLQANGGCFARALPQATPVLSNNILATALQRVLWTNDSISSIISDTDSAIKSAVATVS